MATESRPSGVKRLLLKQKERKEINREAYGTMTVTLTAQRIAFLASRLQFNTDYYLTYGKNNFAEISKNLARYRSKNNFHYQNNYVGHSN